jgi:hypothetical protein
MFAFPDINRASPHAQGLRYCWPMFGQHLGRELVSGAHATLVTGASVRGPQTPILTPTYNGTSHDAVAAVNFGDVSSLTVSFWLYWDVNSNNMDLALEYTTKFWDNSVGGGGNGWNINPNFITGPGFFAGVGGTAGGKSKRFTQPTAAVWRHFVILLDRTLSFGVPALYMDGKSQTLTNEEDHVSVTGNFQANSNLNFMSRNGASAWGAGRICDVRCYAGKLLTSAEAWALYDPRTRWDLYMPVEDQSKWKVTAATGPTAGSLALLGVGR